MTFISYAQNFEDVMLHRAFHDLPRGFYIDVGAQHPKRDSVTHAFYQAGWNGVNIEPVESYFRLLQRARPRDINLSCAVGDTSGDILLHELKGTGLSTVDASFAQRGVERGFEKNSRFVAQTTLDDICAKHGIRDVQFLKIDVEGAEAAVLRGMRFDKVRPTVLVIEATEPCTQTFNHQQWEPYVQRKGYSYVYGDGLNRFYLANERADLTSRFEFPPNCFDHFRRHMPPAALFHECARAVLDSPPLQPVRHVAQWARNALAPKSTSPTG